MPLIRHYTFMKHIREVPPMIKLVPMSEIDRMCCVEYDIEMTGDYTVSTFVLEILNSFKKNWGYIFLYDTDNRDKEMQGNSGSVLWWIL